MKSIGIDFGTTKTLVAYPAAQGGKPEIAHLGRERNSLPTSAFYGEGGSWEFGDDADDYACDAALADRYVSKFKLKLGSMQPVLQIFSEQEFSSFTAREVTTAYLRHLRETCEKEVFNGHPVTEAVMTHPVHFSPSQIADLRYAAEKAGFAAVKLMSEPEAAGLAFCRLCPKDVFNGTALVVDWGGGTLDLALVSREDGRVKVHDKYVAGSDTIGGIVFDELLWKHVGERLQQEHGVSPAEDRKDLIRLQKKKISALKEKLSRAETATLGLSGNHGAYPILKITREELENTILPYVQVGIEGVHDLLGRIREQSLRPTQVLLIGGSSRIPLISKLIEETTGLPCRRWQYSHEAVALGAIVADTKKEASSTVTIEKDTPSVSVAALPHAIITSNTPPPHTIPQSKQEEVPHRARGTAEPRQIVPLTDRGNILAHLSIAPPHDATTSTSTRSAQEKLIRINPEAEAVLKKADETFSGGSETLSIPMYLKAAEMGYSHAQWKLALRYAMGRGVGKDLTEAEKWCRLAARQEHQKAKYTLTQIRFLLTNPHKAEKKISFIKGVKNEKWKITDERRREEDDFIFHLKLFIRYPHTIKTKKGLTIFLIITVLSLGGALPFLLLSLLSSWELRRLSYLAPLLSKDFVKSAYQETLRNWHKIPWEEIVLSCIYFPAAIGLIIRYVTSSKQLKRFEKGIYPEWLSQLLAAAK